MHFYFVPKYLLVSIVKRKDIFSKQAQFLEYSVNPFNNMIFTILELLFYTHFEVLSIFGVVYMTHVYLILLHTKNKQL